MMAECDRSLIYLDYAATTPVDPYVAQKMAECLSIEGIFGNPASQHAFGLKAQKKVEESRKNIANLINTVPRNLLFTSGATEANNLAIKGVAKFYQSRGKHMVTCKTEHKAVLDVCKQLEQEGFSITYLAVKPNGLVDMDAFQSALRPDTVLVSMMQVNNETGVIQDIQAMGEITRKRGIFFHVDAAQSLGKIPIDVQQLPVDLMSFSAHKIYGPKGVGALYVGDNPRVHLNAEMQGGDQERGMRAGTLATHQIVGFGEAAKMAAENLNQIKTDDVSHIKACRDQFWARLRDLPGVVLNSDLAVCVPHILNLRFNQNILSRLLTAGLAVSNGAACNTLTIEPSHVLQAMDLSRMEADCSIRFSFGQFTTPEEITAAVGMIGEIIC